MQLYRLVAILWDIMKRRTNAAAAFMMSDDDSTRYYASLPPVSQIRWHPIDVPGPNGPIGDATEAAAEEIVI